MKSINVPNARLPNLFFLKWIALASCLALGLMMSGGSTFAAIPVSPPPEVTGIPNSDNTSVNSLAFDPTGVLLAGARDDGRVTLWDWNASAAGVVRELSSNSSAAVTGLAFSPDGAILATSSSDSVVRLWDVSSGHLRNELRGHGEAGAVLAVAFSPDGKTVATAGADTKVMLWDVASGSLKGVLFGHRGFVRSVAFGLDVTKLASGSDDANVKVWDVRSGRELRSLVGSKIGVNTVAFSPDGRSLASGSRDGKIMEWNVSTGQLVRTYEGNGPSINALAYSPDGTTLIVAGDNGSVRERRRINGSLIGEAIHGQKIKVRAVAYSADSQTFASAGADGVIKVWNARTMKQKKALTIKRKVKTAFFSQTNSVATADQGVAADLMSAPGPGGPILLITSAGSTNPFGSYYTEILRNEGFNAFQMADISTVTAPTLSAYDVAILTEMTLSTSQVTLFSDWVTGGGRLIAMRPDLKLAGLLGITGPSGTLDGAYLLVNTTKAPGKGIVNQTIQFKGMADRYTLSGAASVATLYSNATTATTNPAVTHRNLGNGQAAAFTYDLARSIVYMRQGNPAWVNQERDGYPPQRSDDMFYGLASFDPQPDWIDLNKVAIPQADEQQRLLANMILEMTKDIKPLPRFWYLPHGFKAAVVMTGDDHGNNGTAGRFDEYIALSPANCSVADWSCIRGTSYIYLNTPLSNAKALSYQNQGFEIALHLNTNCNDYTPAQLESFYVDQLGSWQTKYSSLLAPRTHRTHCIAWDGWTIQPSVELNHGIRFDTNYYYWPPGWVADRPGFFTGSGMPMRFSDLNGNLVDVYHATTQMTDESGQSYPFNPDSLLDRAIGSEQYFGVFTVNAHTDWNPSYVSDSVVTSALVRSIPVVSSLQMLDWIDGRDNSTYNDISWNGTTLSFSVTKAMGANGLQVMVPFSSNGGYIDSIKVNGYPTNYTIQMIKGISYAFLDATDGTVAVTYATDTTPPNLEGNTPASGATGVNVLTAVTVTFSEALDESTLNNSTFELHIGGATGTLVSSSVSYNASTFMAILRPTSPLAYSTSYTVVVKGSTTDPRVKDIAGNALAANYTWSFTTAGEPVCPCSIWAASATPGTITVNDRSAVELGVKFRSDVNGYITGIRFYKGPSNTGTHVGSLWSRTGTLLGQVTFTGEGTTGWQQATFATPVAVTAGTTYIASYHTNIGSYSADNNYFASAGVDNAMLHALRDGIDGGNGLYVYSANPAFPSNAWSSSNYWVDVVFMTSLPQDTTPPIVTGNTPTSGATVVNVSTAMTATFSEALNATTINTNTFELHIGGATGTLVPASVSYNPSTFVATLQPSSPLTNSMSYTAVVKGGTTDPRVKDVAGNALEANYTWSFTTGTASEPVCPCSIWAASATPGTITDNDPNAIELGVKFSSDVNGYITGIRFYKGPSNTGTHVGSLWSRTGTMLGQVTFTGEGTTGWQQATFATPVAVTAGTTYIASYHTNVGYYSGDANYFASAGVDNAPLHALRNGIDGGNGLYVYSANPAFPSNAWSSSNYWVDVVFTPSLPQDTTPPTVTNNMPASGATGVNVSTAVTATFSEALNVTTINSNTFELHIGGATGTLVPASVSYNPSTFVATLQPSSPLTNSMSYTAVVKGGTTDPRVKDVAGNALGANYTWSFTTAAVDTTPPIVTGNTPASGATGVNVSAVTATFSEALNATTINTNTFELIGGATGTLVAASVSYNPSTFVATLQPSSPLTNSTSYTAVVKGGTTDPRVKDVAGNALTANFTWSFTTGTASGPVCPCSIWAASATPGTITDNDPNAIELGVKFSSDVNGYITGIRFYKGPSNTGTHVGSLWSRTGTLLGQVTFTGEGTTGWQQATFATPVAVTAGTTYIASYHTNVGYYSTDANYFASAGVDNAPLHALRNGIDGGNGVYVYSANPAFPSNAWSSSNYWVDVVFTTSI